MNRAGRVKITPEASELEAEPVVCERLASRIVPSRPARRRSRNIATVITATGMEVLTVSPARRPR